MTSRRKIAFALVLLGLLAPLGLLLPDYLHSGAAWGEWSRDEIRALVGYVPAKMARTGDTWKAPVPDYALPEQKKGITLSYAGSALLGMAVVGGVTLAIGRLLARRERKQDAP